MKSVFVAVLAAAAAVPAGAAAPGSITYRDAVWSPNGKQIAFISDRDATIGYPDVYLARADGSNVRRLTSSEIGKTGLTWSPGGRWVAYQAYAYIDETSVDGTTRRRLTGYGGYAPDFSPSGRRIAFASGTDTKGGSIYVMRPDGNKKTLVAAAAVYESLGAPTWSPDGERLAFSVGTAPDSNLVTPYLAIVSQYRGRRQKLLLGHTIFSTDWSPDGRRILLVDDPVLNDPSGDYRVSVLDLRTRKLRVLGQRGTLTARWSPDGRRILFGRGGAIYVMNADGSQVRRLLG